MPGGEPHLIKSAAAIDYRAEYPFAYLGYRTPGFPVAIAMRAWTPFVPRQTQDSSLPGFYIDVTVTNPSRSPVEVSLVWQMQNLAGFAADQRRQEHLLHRAARSALIRMRGGLDDPGHETAGELTMWATAEPGQKITAIAANPYLQNIIWSIHRTGGLAGPLLPPHLKREELAAGPGAPPDKGWLCLQATLGPRQATTFRCGLAWFFPNCHAPDGTPVGHMYRNWFADSAAAAKHLIKNRARLESASRLLPESIMGSDLPIKLRLALLDQLSTLTKSSQFIESGRFGLREGLGCCAFNTVDVDHYSSYALSCLQPPLRRQITLQNVDLAHPANGKIHHGLGGSVAPVAAGGEQGYNRWDCCAQFALQVYRDTKWSGDRALLKHAYPAVKRAMDLLATINFYGIGLPYIEGGITYDHWRMKGVVTYMAGIYLAALRALEEMADLLGDAPTAAACRTRFGRGLESFERFLWHGDRYSLYYALKRQGWRPGDEPRGEEGHLDPQPPPELAGGDRGCGGGCCSGEPLFAVRDTGVMTDILNGNATAAVLGLGAFLDPARVGRQLRLVLRENLQEENLCVVNGTYPDDRFPDEWPFMQWQTPWTGTEYFLALQLYAAGLLRAGDRVIDLVHDRHVAEGMRFNHAECSDHYARPPSIWGAYYARIGLDPDALRGRLRFAPAGTARRYRGAFVFGTGLARGRYAFSAKSAAVDLEFLEGGFRLREIVVPAPRRAQGRIALTLDGRPVKAAEAGGDAAATVIRPQAAITLRPGSRMRVRVG